MNAALGPYSALIVPALIAVVAIWLALRIARALIHLLVVVLVIALLVWGYTQYQHAAGLQAAAQQLATQAGQGTRGSSAAYGAVAAAVLAHAPQVLAQAGLDPTALRASVSCAGGAAVLVLRETQTQGLLGLPAGSDVRVRLSPAIHCGP